jgi:hypothetical protein
MKQATLRQQTLRCHAAQVLVLQVYPSNTGNASRQETCAKTQHWALPFVVWAIKTADIDAGCCCCS